MSQLRTIAMRKKLPITTKHPRWEKLSTGRSIGILKLQSGEFWVARLAANGKHQHTRLGEAAIVQRDGKMSYNKAVQAANEWFSTMDAAAGRYTVQQSIDRYVKKLRLNNGADAARRTKARLENHVPDVMRRTSLKKLTVEQLSDWRDDMTGIMSANLDPDGQRDVEAERQGKASANRILTMLKAALNYSYELGKVDTNKWTKVKPFAGTDKGKANLLTDRQVTALLKQTEGSFKDLVTAAILTGARYGELGKALVSDFNESAGTLLLKTKKGGSGDYRERVSVLSDAGVKFFSTLTRNSQPGDYLLQKKPGIRWSESDQSRPFKYARQATKDNKKKDRVPGWATFYSLRHYNLSAAVMAGLSLTDVATNAGTSVAMLEKTYSKSSDDFKRQQLNAVQLAV